jgi:hypothetical protein
MSAAQPESNRRDDLDRFGPTKEAAVLTGYSPRTYERWRMEGIGPPFVRAHNGRCRYHLRTVLEYFLKRQRGDV